MLPSFTRNWLGAVVTTTSFCATSLFVMPAVTTAQTTALPDSIRTDSVKKDSAKSVPPKPKSTIPPLSVSGTLFGNYQYQGAHGPTKAQNKFDIERAYITIRAGISDNMSTRITADIYQPGTGGWVARLKYAYLQYDYLKKANFSASARLGMIQTGLYEYEETVWPRWISATPLDRAGYFSSSDVGVSTTVTFPHKLAEFYAAILDGSGYSSPENNRFKDYEARVTLTPLAATHMPALLKSLAIVPHYYKGTTTSSIPNESHGLIRDRYGVLVDVREPRFTAGVDFAQRKDGTDTLVSGTRNVNEGTGRLIAAYTTIRPMQLFDSHSHSPLGLVLRYDDIKPNTSTDAHTNTFIGGLTWELNQKVSLALDYQESTPKHGATGNPSKLYFLHWVANF